MPELLPCHYRGVCHRQAPYGDGVVDESDKSPTTASSWAIAPDSGIACEFLERGVHAQFGLLHVGDQYLVTVQEVQFILAVKDAVAFNDLNYRNLSLSMACPGAVVLVWARGVGLIEKESPDERVERVRSM